MATQTPRYVGTSLPRKEDAHLLTGQGRWVDEIRPAGLLHLQVLRSQVAHARIRGIDATAARAAPGVVAVLTGDDLAREWANAAPAAAAEAPARAVTTGDGEPGDDVRVTPTGDPQATAPPMSFCAWPVTPDIRIANHWPVAREEVNYAGEPLAIVAATDRALARDALELIEVDLEELPVVTDVEAALEDGAPLVHEALGTNRAYDWTLATGDVDAAFAQADVVVRGRYLQQRLIGNAIEPRGVVALPDPVNGGVTLYTSTQVPHIAKAVLSAVCGVPEHLLRVVAPDVGGGFGNKLNVYPEEAVAVVLARRLGAPVKWIEDRSENYLATTHGRGQVQYLELASTSEGDILGMKVRLVADMGAYLQLLTPGIAVLGSFTYPGLYDFGAYAFECSGAYVNKTPTDSYRGAGRTEAAYAHERIVDDLARALDMDPAELRRRNFHAPFSEPKATPGGVQYDSGDYEPALDRALELADYAALRAEQRERRERGDSRALGIGIGCFTESGGLSPSKVNAAVGLQGPGWEAATVRMLPSGKAEVVTGTSPHGQGHVTSWSQIAADALGIAPDDVDVLHGDTAIAPYGRDTYGSRSAPVGGSAVHLAAGKVVEKAREIAAHQLEAAPEDLEFAEGRFEVRGVPGRGLTIQELAAAAFVASDLPDGMEPGLMESQVFDPPNFTWPFGVHVCVVEVDTETGAVDIRAYVAVDDCGPVINPMIVDGQVQGGVAQGIGQALFEEAVHDEDGQLLSGSMIAYHVPGAPEIPRMVLDRTETPSPSNPLGVKGIGESGTIASSPAVVNAVIDALAHLGVTHIDMPASPSRVWQAIQEARG